MGNFTFTVAAEKLLTSMRHFHGEPMIWMEFYVNLLFSKKIA